MARKSRTLAPAILLEQKSTPTYKVGLYVRLSVLDSGKKDSDTVQNQENILRSFIADKPEFHLQSVYVDNGETGVHFKRDAFEELLEDVRTGKINCIIVKDLSRFGRNFIEVGDYLEKVFPCLGVRFIAVGDRYDSIDPSTASTLSMHLKNLVNTVYATDISAKICPVLRGKQERGEFIGAWASYGYLKSEKDKHRLVADDEVSHIVRDVFQWRLQGMSYQMIARKLNDLGIPSPSAYRYNLGLVRDKRLKDLPWRVSTIKTMTANEVYLGHMVQGRKQEALWKNQKQNSVPKDQWIIVQNTHEAIVDAAIFEKVQQVNEQAKADYHAKQLRFAGLENTENILKSLVYCGDCGKLLVRYKNVRENKTTDNRFHVWYSYICPYHANDPSKCSFISIPEKALLSAVFAVIETQMALALDIDKMIRSAKHRSSIASEHGRLQGEIRRTIDELARIEHHRNTLYDDYLEKLMTEQDYVFAQNRYKDKTIVLEKQLEQLKQADCRLSEDGVEANPWLTAMLCFRDEPVLTRGMAEALIDHVVVYDKSTIHVTLRYEDELKCLWEGLSPALGVAVND